MPMKKLFVCAGLLCTFSLPVASTDFCDGSRLVRLDQVLSRPGDFINKRVQTRAVLKTDAKEYTRISLAEGSNFSILTTGDDESTAYGKTHDLSNGARLSVVDDLNEKLRATEGARYKPDMSKIRYYRQNVVVCGRLVRSAGEWRFAVDDMHVEDSYLLPLKSEKLGAVNDRGVGFRFSITASPHGDWRDSRD